MRKKVIYVRRSLKQNKQKTSINTQITACLEVAKNNGWVIHDIYNEGDCSARKTSIEERPLLKQLLLDCQNGTIEKIIVFKRDRFARNTEQYLEILDHLLHAGVDIIFAADNEPPIFKGPIGNFIETVLAGIAEYEGENINNRLIESRRVGMKEGKWMAGAPPKYLKLRKDKTVYIEEVEKKIFKMIFEEFINSKSLTLRKIKKEMKSRNPKLNKFKLNLEEIIPRPLFKGKLIQHLKGKTYECPRILDDIRCVDDKIWEEANRKWSDLGFQREKKEGYQPILPSKFVCGRCKKIMKKGTKFYSCTLCKEKVEIEKIEEIVLQEVIMHLQNLANTREEELRKAILLRVVAPIQKKIDDAKKQISETQLDIEKETIKYARFKKNQSVFENLMKKYQDEVKIFNDLCFSKTVLEEKIRLFNIMKLDDMDFDSLSVYQKNILLDFIKEIRLKNGHYDIVVSYGTRKEHVS
ncbi:recombinase family protein [Neobacillus cucumis]|nr:recombinase family protein [Neobacillus cucumis]